MFDWWKVNFFLTISAVWTRMIAKPNKVNRPYKSKSRIYVQVITVWAYVWWDRQNVQHNNSVSAWNRTAYWWKIMGAKCWIDSIQRHLECFKWQVWLVFSIITWQKLNLKKNILPKIKKKKLEKIVCTLYAD